MINHNLTKQEVAVLGLMAEGWTNQDIAEGLYISEKTLCAHINRIYRKLSDRIRGKSKRVAAVLYYQEQTRGFSGNTD